MRSPGEKKWLGTCLWHFVMPAICSAGVSLAELSVPEDPSDIVCASVSPSSLEVAVCTDNKSLALWKRREEGEAGDACWTWQGKRYVWKRREEWEAGDACWTWQHSCQLSLTVRLTYFALEVSTQFILVLCTYLYYSYGSLT